MRTFFTVTTLLVSVLLFGQHPQIYQLSDGGIPWSFKNSQLDRDIVYETMPGFDVNAMLAEDEYNETHFHENPGPWRFGYNYYTSYRPSNSGSWTVLDNGDKIWRLGIVCPNAITINLAFQYVNIPEGAQLFVYNIRKTQVLGAFTQKYVSEDYTLGTELLNGDTIIVEYIVPNLLESVGDFEIFRVTHGYRSTLDYITKAFGDAGSCNMNVNCPDGAPWSNQKRSVVMLVSGGNGFCTGALINNSCNDGKPYVLTANHCGSSGFGSWVFRFNWEAPGCTNPPTSPSYQSLSGSTSRANRPAADMRLVEINSAVPASYNAYWSGWNRSATPPPSAVCIHHPSGDIKKISFDDAALNVTTAMGGETNCCWEVEWDRNTTTEPGSSGSPLFDNNGRIIGQLWGGGASCTNLSSPDYYGRVFNNWNPAGSTSSQQLKYWLDPAACSTNAMFIDGYDPNMPSVALDAQIVSITTPSSTECDGSNISPVVVLKNNGTNTLTSATISYTVDGGPAVNYSWTGSLSSTATTNVTLPSFSTGSGNHTITVTVSNPNGGSDMNTSNDTQTKNFDVVAPSPLSLPFTEGFESTTFPPTGWINENPNNNTGNALWVRTTNASGFGNSTACALIDQFSPSSSTVGQVDNLITPYLDLTTGGSNIQLSFSVANVRYNATYYDSLIVSITTDCGATWTRLASYGNNTGPSPLATAPDQTSSFVPNSSQWETKTISLNSYATQNAVRIRFQLRSGWGNNTYIDDINIFNPSPPSASFNAPTSICAGETITLTNTSTNSTGYSWSIPGGTPSSSTDANPNVTFNNPGTYTVTLTASNSNGTSTSTATIVVNSLPNVSITGSNSICLGQSVTLTANGGNTYIWNNSATTSSINVSPTITTTYTVTATGTNGCTSTASHTITVNNLPNASISGPSNICSGQSVTLNASGGVSYSWSNGSNSSSINVNPSSNTTYTVTVTNADNCTATATHSITVNNLPVISTVNVTNPSSCGSSDGSITINATGPGTLSYSIDGGNTYSTSNVFSGLVAGNYSISVQSSNGCSVSGGIYTIAPGASPSAPTATGNQSICVGQTASTISATPGSGGTITWYSDASLNNIISNSSTLDPNPYLNVGVNNFYVTETVSGCESPFTYITIVVNTLPNVTITGSNSICYGDATLLTASGGDSYLWNTSATTASITVSPGISTTYTVTATSSNGCTNSGTISITVNPVPNVSISGATNICDPQPVLLTASGGNSYLWNDGNTNSSITVNPSTTTTYTVTATSTNGCTASASHTVNVSTSPNVTVSGINTICQGESVVLSASGGNTYLWNNNSNTPTITVSPSTTTTYTVTATSTAGCTASASIVITVNSLPVVTISGETTICSGQSTTLIGSGGNSYSWSNGNTTSSISVSPTTTTTYTVTATDLNGCTATASTSVTVLNCNSLDEVMNTSNFVVYPNPATDMFTIVLHLASAEPLKGELMTTLGQVLQQFTIAPSQQQITLITDGLSSGIYLLRISDGKQSVTQRIIVVK